MIKIKVKLNSFLKKYSTTDEKEEHLEMAEGIRVQDILKHYGIGNWEVMLVLVDGNLSDINDKLQDGNFVDLYPIFAGG